VISHIAPTDMLVGRYTTPTLSLLLYRTYRLARPSYNTYVRDKRQTTMMTDATLQHKRDRY